MRACSLAALFAASLVYGAAGCGGHVDLGTDGRDDGGSSSHDTASSVTDGAAVEATPDDGTTTADAAMDDGPAADAVACTPPTFAGITAIDSITSSSVNLRWDPATDDTTGAAEIAYEVFVATAPGSPTLTPELITSKGTTSVVIAGLVPSTTYYFVVRALGASGCASATTKEVSATTTRNCGLATAIQPIFDKRCAFAGCHVLPTPPQGLPLSSGFSYAYLVNVVSVEHPPMKRVLPFDPANSELFYTVSGTLLPDGSTPPHGTKPTLTPAEIDLVKCWIENGP